MPGSAKSSISVEELLKQDERKDLLRFSTVGSIDDGKSTLIGRLLYDSKSVYEDHIASVKKLSTEKASDEKMDMALLTDGLRAEREQGITIDVAHRYFSTPKRKFIIADTPGHEQYTRNMATGASTANLAIILMDARTGVLPQTKRHAFITTLLGVPHIVVAVNKMDMVGYSEEAFNSVRNAFSEFAAKLRASDLRFVPISALKGDNVVVRSSRMKWYRGEPLLELLESIYIASDHNMIDLRYPVQYVLRPNQDFRGYAGQVASGVIRKGDEIMVLPSMKTSRIKAITTFDGELEYAFPPLSVTVTLEDEIDISRGDMLVHCHNIPAVARHFEAMVVWMSEKEMDPNGMYLVKHTTRTIRASIDEIRYKIDVNTVKRAKAGALRLNEIGRVVFSATQPIYYDPYDRNRATGSFIIIDPIDNHTLGAGMIISREPTDQLPVKFDSAAEQAEKIVSVKSRIDGEKRAQQLGQKPVTIWLTGLAGCGKEDIAYGLERRLFDLHASSVVLDGESGRHDLDKETDFSSSGSSDHLKRVVGLARLLNDSGQIVICSFLSPWAEVRRHAADLIGPGRFLEIHVDASVEWCRGHDKTGIYTQADEGHIRNLAGVNLTYEKPGQADLVIESEKVDTATAVDRVLALLKARGFFPLPESRQPQNNSQT